MTDFLLQIGTSNLLVSMAIAIGHLRRLGVSDEAVAAIRTAFQESGILDRQFDPVMGALIRIAYVAGAERDRFEPDPGVLARLQGMGLTNGQIKLVRRIALSITRVEGSGSPAWRRP